MNAADIQTLKEKVTRNTAANADQGVAIAQNAQSITGLRNDLDYVITHDGVRQLGTIKKPMTLEEVYAAKEA